MSFAASRHPLSDFSELSGAALLLEIADCPGLENPALPLEIEPAEDAGKVWLKQDRQLPILAAMENLWEITEAPGIGWPQLRMNFQAITEDGQRLRIFQDLLEGKWYLESAALIPGQ